MATLVQKSIGLQASQWKRLAKMAKDANRTLAGYIRDVLGRHLQQAALQ